MKKTNQRPRIKTSMGTLTENTITVRGKDLVNDLMGRIDTAALLFLEVTGRLPSDIENALLNAMIVSIAEHGMMPSVIAARLTLMGAPESFQGAVASGLLGAGDVFVGPTSNVARMLQVEAKEFRGGDSEIAESLVALYASRKQRMPGLGHPHHSIDPRSEKLLEMQSALGAPQKYTKLMLEVQKIASKRLGRHLTFNAVAAVGSIASDIGFDWRAVRGIGLVARTIGLIGHVFEEITTPSAQVIWDLVHDNADYSHPADSES